MGLFTKTKKEETKKAKATKGSSSDASKEALREVKAPAVKAATPAKLAKEKKEITAEAIFSDVIISPRITEKSSWSAENNTYVFNVNPRSNKKQVSGAIKEIYGVTPIKINITPVPSKKVFSKGVRGTKSGGKKAIVYLKKGDTIEII